MPHRLLALAILAALAGTARPAAADEPPAGLNVQVVQGMLGAAQPDVARALARPLRELLARQIGPVGRVDFAPDALTLADRLAAGECQLGVFHGYEFAWARARHPGLVPLVVTVYPETKRPQAAVVVRKDAAGAGLADLAGRAVAVPRGTRGHCLAYLDRARSGLPDGAAAPTPTDGAAADALDAVATGTSPAAVVDRSALAGYAELQPGAARRLRVLCQSDPFPQNVLAYARGALTADRAAELRKALVRAHTTAAGKPLMLLWGITELAEPPADYVAQLARSLEEYPAPR